jgi:hypothetical protein
MNTFKAPKFSIKPKVFTIWKKPKYKHKLYFSFVWLGFVIFFKYGEIN